MGKAGLGAHEETKHRVWTGKFFVASYLMVSPQGIKSHHLHPSTNISVKTTKQIERGRREWEREREEKKGL